jgi:hypothetical protein
MRYTLTDISENCGSIQLELNGVLYQYQWGAMDGTISEFISSISGDYFASKLLGTRSRYSFCYRKTFRNLRRFIKEEIMNHYEYMVFQKQMREVIRDFQNQFEEKIFVTKNDFVNYFDSYFLSELDFTLIPGDFDSQYVERNFKDLMNEPWGFIGEKYSDEYLSLLEVHKIIKQNEYQDN